MGFNSKKPVAGVLSLPQAHACLLAHIMLVASIHVGAHRLQITNDSLFRLAQILRHRVTTVKTALK